jgi:hypothetical protein
MNYKLDSALQVAGSTKSKKKAIYQNTFNSVPRSFLFPAVNMAKI